jgi:2-oxoglutarate dehydrogenase complex dehydrogenase (E1) component-like enzyme
METRRSMLVPESEVEATGSKKNLKNLLDRPSSAVESPEMVQFEYKIFSKVSKTTRGGQSIDWSGAEKSLNELVAEGWELVSSNASGIGLMVFGCGSVEPVATFVLRRTIQR